MSLIVNVPSASAGADFNQRMLELINRDRVANNLRPVVADASLSAAAEDAPYTGCGFPVAGRAKDMGERNYFSHSIKDCPNQSVFNIVNSIAGLVVSGTGENIAWMNGATDPLVAAENLHGQLMSSAGHRANILNGNFTRVGIGSWHTAQGQTWSGGGYSLTNVYIGVQIFAGGPVEAAVSAIVQDSGSKFHPVTPSRILDTRDGTGAPAAAGPGATLALPVTGRGGIPSTGVSAVVLNVTVTQPTAPSYLTVFPTGEARPVTANLNFGPGQTVPNLVVAKLGANGQVSVFNAAGTTHVIADVAGWYDTGIDLTGSKFHPVTPS
ncbi:MAG TPA: CAP domain-containing protein, partial [Acidimicrobiales bacterium]|nr:CAP domain-containing protein [Acidimicrobiales bacterium]